MKCGVETVKCKFCSTKWYWAVFWAMLRVDCNSGKSFVQVLWYEVVFKPATHVFQNHAKFMSD